MSAFVSSAGIFLQRPGAEVFAGVVLLLLPAGGAPEAFVAAVDDEDRWVVPAVAAQARASGWHVHLVHVLVHPVDSREGTFGEAAAAAVADLPTPHGRAAPLSPAALRTGFGPGADVFSGPDLPDAGMASRVRLWIPTAPGVARLDLTLAGDAPIVRRSGAALSDAGLAHQLARATRIARRQAGLAARALAAGADAPGDRR